MNRIEPKGCTNIGLTGGIGSGKSSVAVLWRTVRSLHYLDADQVCRELLEPHAEGWQAFRDVFGNQFFGADGSVNRPLLRRILFKDNMVREQVNGILHPLARQVIRKGIKENREAGAAPLVVEVPLLFEAGWRDDFEQVVVVYADADKCLHRLMRRDQLSSQEAMLAWETQKPLVEKVLQADHVVDNSGNWADTSLQLLHLDKVVWGEDS